MCNLLIQDQEDPIDGFHLAYGTLNLEKVKYFLENKLVHIDMFPSLFLNAIEDSPGFYQLMDYLIEKGIPKDYYLFSLPEIMTYELEDLLINYTHMNDKRLEKSTTIALNLGVLVNGMDANYYNKTALDVFFEKFKETDPEFQMPLVQKLIGLGARRFSDLPHQERVLNSDIMTAMQYSLEDLKAYFAHRKAKGWNYPNQLPPAIFSIRQAAKQSHLNFKGILDKVEFVASQYPIESAFEVLCEFLNLNGDYVYRVSSSCSPGELTQVLQMLFRHEELSWQFKLSEVKNPLLLEEIAEYLRSGGHHEVADQFLFRASLA